MKIDIVIGVADRGGVENVINMTGAYLVRRGVHVRIVQLVWEHHPWVDDAIEFYYLSDDRYGWDIGKFICAYEEFLTNHDKPDLILAAGWPYLCQITRQAVAGIGMKCPIGSWLHGPIERYVAAGFGGIEPLVHADFHLAINNRIARQILAGYPNARVYRINNPVMTSRIHYADKRGDSRRLVFVGRFSKEKNMPLILDALTRAPAEWELSVYGNGEHDEYQEYVSVCQKNPLLSERVHFHGWVDDPWHSEEDAFGLVMASKYEGFPLTAIEALMCGMPVISTPVDGIVELIRPGENGFVYPMDDAEALAKILRFISENKLPAVSSVKCRESSRLFQYDIALGDMYDKLLDALEAANG